MGNPNEPFDGPGNQEQWSQPTSNDPTVGGSLPTQAFETHDDAFNVEDFMMILPPFNGAGDQEDERVHQQLLELDQLTQAISGLPPNRLNHTHGESAPPASRGVASRQEANAPTSAAGQGYNVPGSVVSPAVQAALRNDLWGEQRGQSADTASRAQVLETSTPNFAQNWPLARNASDTARLSAAPTMYLNQSMNGHMGGQLGQGSSSGVQRHQGSDIPGTSRNQAHANPAATGSYNQPEQSGQTNQGAGSSSQHQIDLTHSRAPRATKRHQVTGTSNATQYLPPLNAAALPPPPTAGLGCPVELRAPLFIVPSAPKKRVIEEYDRLPHVPNVGIERAFGVEEHPHPIDIETWLASCSIPRPHRDPVPKRLRSREASEHGEPQ